MLAVVSGFQAIGICVLYEFIFSFPIFLVVQ
jgi:hypothetical protein